MASCRGFFPTLKAGSSTFSSLFPPRYCRFIGRSSLNDQGWSSIRSSPRRQGNGVHWNPCAWRKFFSRRLCLRFHVSQLLRDKSHKSVKITRVLHKAVRVEGGGQR